ncbi:MAG: amino acid ABC transporter ATP-binding/permease protein [Propioniciclava sp.]
MTPSLSFAQARRLSGWLATHTSDLVPLLTVSVVARVTNRLLGIALLVLPVIALGRIQAGGEVIVGQQVAILVVIAVSKALLRYLEHYTGHWVAFHALQRLRVLLFERLIPQAPAATTGRSGADLTDRATRDIDRIEVFFAHTFPPAVSAVAVPTIALSWLALEVNGWMALGAALWMVAIVIFVPVLSARASWSTADDVASARGDLAAQLGDDLQGIRTLRSFNAVDRRQADIESADVSLVRLRSAAGRGAGVRAGAVSVLRAGSLLAPVLIGVNLGLPPSALAIAATVAVGCWGGMRGLDDFVSNLADAFAATARIQSAADAAPLVVDPSDPAALPADNTLTTHAASLRYPDASTQALADVDATFNAGSWTFVVGVSGSGKSTLASLLVRAWDPDSGSVLLDGVNVAGAALDDLRRRVAYVSQRPVMFSGTLADNLRLGNPTSSDEALWQALTAVDLDGWAASAADGLDSPVGERGLTVSGGQLQRLSIARSLVGQPTVLILDEALSQLDAVTADLVRNRLRGTPTPTGEPLTVIEVTHRADLIPDDAWVYVLDAGRVTEAGVAGELRNQGGDFARVALRA